MTTHSRYQPGDHVRCRPTSPHEPWADRPWFDAKLIGRQGDGWSATVTRPGTFFDPADVDDVLGEQMYPLEHEIELIGRAKPLSLRICATAIVAAVLVTSVLLLAHGEITIGLAVLVAAFLCAGAALTAFRPVSARFESDDHHG